MLKPIIEFGDWTDWTMCNGACGTFGTQNRSKPCYGDGEFYMDEMNCTFVSNETYSEEEKCYMDHYPCYSKLFAFNKGQGDYLIFEHQ